MQTEVFCFHCDRKKASHLPQNDRENLTREIPTSGDVQSPPSPEVGYKQQWRNIQASTVPLSMKRGLRQGLRDSKAKTKLDLPHSQQ